MEQTLKPTLDGLIDSCASITRRKGFKTQEHATQILLMASECAEAIQAIEYVNNVESDSELAAARAKLDLVDTETLFAIGRLLKLGNTLEENRTLKGHWDDSKIKDFPNLMEELADQCIRVFSYVGGNGWKDQFVQALMAKIDKNTARPYKHGKEF